MKDRNKTMKKNRLKLFNRNLLFQEERNSFSYKALIEREFLVLDGTLRSRMRNLFN